MCPFCIATATAVWIAAGTTSTVGLSALVINRIRTTNKGEKNEHEQ